MMPEGSGLSGRAVRIFGGVLDLATIVKRRKGVPDTRACRGCLGTLTVNECVERSGYIR